MWLKLTKGYINTDGIDYAEDRGSGAIELHFCGGEEKLYILERDVKKIRLALDAIAEEDEDNCNADFSDFEDDDDDDDNEDDEDNDPDPF